MLDLLKYIFLGKWLGHPLHPAIVHVPIGLWVGAFVFDICSRAGWGGNGLVRASYWAIAGGLLATLVVVPAGLAEWSQIKREKPAWAMALWHMLINLAVVVLLLISLLMRGAGYFAERVATGPFVLMVIAICGLAVSSYIGGRMVYDQGIGVGRGSKAKWRKMAADSHANLPPQT